MKQSLIVILIMLLLSTSVTSAKQPEVCENLLTTNGAAIVNADINHNRAIEQQEIGKILTVDSKAVSDFSKIGCAIPQNFIASANQIQTQTSTQNVGMVFVAIGILAFIYLQRKSK